MRVRAITSSGDFTFGAGLSNYKFNNLAIMQNIQTRLQSFLGNCFFDLGAGINWFYLLGTLGTPNQIALNLAISSVILNTTGVIKLIQLSISEDSNRNIAVNYRVLTQYSISQAGFTLPVNNMIG